MRRLAFDHPGYALRRGWKQRIVLKQCLGRGQWPAEAGRLNRFRGECAHAGGPGLVEQLQQRGQDG